MASNVIYYFTGTGNSLFAARRIAKIIGETQLVHMTKQEDYILPDDLISIGLVFPVYIFGLPLIVERCIEKLKIYKNVYIYAVVTHGGIPSATLTQAEKELSKKGIRLSAGFEVLMIDNATMNADIITKEKQQKRIKDAEIKIESICKMIKDESNSIYRGWPLVNWLFSGLYNKVKKEIPTFDKNFVLDSNCNGCGICETVCPVNNIQIMNEKPVWNHNCEQCLACFHWCPQVAIQYGVKTKGRSRFQNPNIKLQDIIEKNG